MKYKRIKQYNNIIIKTRFRKMESSNVISHVINETIEESIISEHSSDIKSIDRICKNVKSKTNTKERCKNNATHGSYCGLHYKNPKPFINVSVSAILKDEEKKVIEEVKDSKPKSKCKKSKSKVKENKKLTCVIDYTKEEVIKACEKIVKWVKFRYYLRCLKRQGPARFDRTLATNADDFYTCIPIDEIKNSQLFSFLDKNDKQIYACDIRSIHSMIHYSKLEGQKPQNPYTRNIIDFSIVKKMFKHVEYCMKIGVSYEYEPLRPPSPSQAFRMKVVDIFNSINELNYYSSPEWFLTLDLNKQKRFYRELFDIWNVRAGLTAVQKNKIVPHYSTKIFKHSPNYVNNMATLEEIQKYNLNIIKILISSAVKDRKSVV